MSTRNRGGLLYTIVGSAFLSAALQGKNVPLAIVALLMLGIGAVLLLWRGEQ